jgi:hypothetical protein
MSLSETLFPAEQLSAFEEALCFLELISRYFILSYVEPILLLGANEIDKK